MYAVVTTGGKQYKVEPGDVLRVEKIEADKGETIELNQVHLISQGDSVVTDADALAGAKVLCAVQCHGRGKKIRVFKYKKRKNYKKTRGHRQDFTELKVQDIQA